MISSIRHAEPSDIPDIIDMGREFFEQSRSSEFTTFDESSFATTVIGLMSGLSGGVLLVAECEGKSVGMAACVAFPFYANMATRIAQELFWFVRQDWRNGVGASLLDELEKEAMRGGAQVFLTGALSGVRDKAIARVYGRRGYAPSENTFVKRLDS